MNLIGKLIGLVILSGSIITGWMLMEIESFSQSRLNLPEIEDNRNSYWRYTIAPGRSLTSIAAELSEHSMIEHPNYLIWIARYRRLAGKIKAGEYSLEPGLTVNQFLDKITRGDVIQYPLTIVEGWNFRQLWEYMAKMDNIKNDLENMDNRSIMSKLGYPDTHPEGRFLPDTYYYTQGMLSSQILKRAYIAMDDFLGKAWGERDIGLPLASQYDALVLASIIEKETAVASERKQIAGVFIRRLQQRMRLQTDPTVIYGLGSDFDGNLRSRDLKLDTPYNTYTRHGLPPTPISMPGAESILAALHPDDGDTLYFVARGDGTHYFSSTITEHNQAVRKYQLKKSANDSK